MTQMTKLLYTIREVSSRLGVPASTLRYWEKEFPMLEPKRTEKGRRRYSADDFNLCERIRELLHDRGMKIEAVKAHLKETYHKHAPRNPFACDSKDDAVTLLRDVERTLAIDRHASARIEAVIGWLEKE